MDASTVTGLTASEVADSRSKHGRNVLELPEDKTFLQVLKGIVTEPMFILLLVACAVYLLLREYREGMIMLTAIFMVAGISFFQDYRSRSAVKALKQLSAARARVIRDGLVLHIPAEEIVVNDILLAEEGEILAADGLVADSHDFSVDESILTGESLPVIKTAAEDNKVYKNTLVVSGSAAVRVVSIGNATMAGKIGASLSEITVQKTPLQVQIASFVRTMAVFGIAAFVIVVGFNYYQSGSWTKSLLLGLTMAMSILPEEIPVAFSTFQALGALWLLRHHIIVKQPQYVETLGSATVICTDKTGTLTQNRMSIAWLYDAATQTSVQGDTVAALPLPLVEYAMWASESTPFDPMEKAIHALYEKSAGADKRPRYRQIHEYPVGGVPPMMTHIFSGPAADIIIAAKGAPEAILRQCNLSPAAIKQVEEQILLYTREGYRVLGVGRGIWDEKSYPLSQSAFSFDFLGLVAFYDPPKAGITETIRAFRQAGIQVKMITGDYPETAKSIAAQIHLGDSPVVLTGKDVMQLTPFELRQQVKAVDIFARMFPEAKLKVIGALKENGEVVAMTGDGVNDGPALKAAHIGIAMGLRGSEVARRSAALLLADDDLGHMVEAVAIGRKIYDNIKKAVQYIVSIHIPIILIVILPLLLAWKFTGIFSPVHVVFLELIMGPTCSIVYGNEPMEAGAMLRPPRRMESTFLSAGQLAISLIQGLVITAGCLGIGYYYMYRQQEEAVVRTVIFITLLLGNVLLTLVNRSFTDSVFSTLKYKNRLMPLIIGVTLFFIAALLYWPFVRQLFRLAALPPAIIGTCAVTAMVSVAWIEAWKGIKRIMV